MKVLTAYRLKKLGACPSARLVFKRTFGQQARITRENLDKAEGAGLYVTWLAEALGLIPLHQYDAKGECPACRAEAKLGGTYGDSRLMARRALLRAARG